MSIATSHLRRRHTVLASVTAALLGVLALGAVVFQSAAVAEGDAADDAAADADVVSDADASVDTATTVVDLDTFQLALKRDPFDPVRPPVVETTSTDDDDSGSTSGGGTGGENGSSTNGSGETTAACTTSGEVVCDGKVVSVLSTVHGGDSAVIQVDGTTHQVSVGETFAGQFRLLAIDDEGCARIVYGDEAFTQCPGDTLLK